MPRANRQAVTQTGHRTSCFNNPDRFRIPLLDQLSVMPQPTPGRISKRLHFVNSEPETHEL